MKTNTSTRPVLMNAVTHEGAPTRQLSAEEQLRRTVMTCLLGEDVHYEAGVTATDRIKTLVPLCRPEFVAACAFEARTKMHMRHVPLLIVREMARYPKHRRLVKALIPDVIYRADELAEFMAIYMKEGKQFLSNPVRRGLAKTFEKFSAFQLAKYNRDAQWKLRDVVFLTHPSRTKEELPPISTGHERTYANGVGYVLRHPGSVLDRLVLDALETPVTWETELSAGKDKRATFEQLMKDNQLGGLAFIRNLRNMREAGVPKKLVEEYATRVNLHQVLPFRFMAAAKACPEWADLCDMMMLRSCGQLPHFAGKTLILVDCSGSMVARLHGKSDMNRIEAAGALAAILREQCEEAVVYATAGMGRTHLTELIPSNYRGLALVKYLNSSELSRKIGGGGIFMRQAIEYVDKREKDFARVVVVTDEQDCDADKTDAKCLGKFNYVLNVAQYNVGINYKKGWDHIHGWSDHVLQYISYAEANK